MEESLIVLPTYNEAQNLEVLVRKLSELGKFNILIIDDNSPDGTGEIAETLQRRHLGKLEVLHRPGKMGLGTAYVQGFQKALDEGYQYIFQMDADFSHDPAYLPQLRAALEQADVAIGSRYVTGGGTKNWPLWRVLLSRGGSAYASTILGIPLHDLTGGFKGFKREVLENIGLDEIRSSGYSFQIEMNYRCFKKSFRIVEIPIVFEDRKEGYSKMSRKIFWEAMLMVWKLRLGIT